MTVVWDGTHRRRRPRARRPLPPAARAPAHRPDGRRSRARSTSTPRRRSRWCCPSPRRSPGRCRAQFEIRARGVGSLPRAALPRAGDRRRARRRRWRASRGRKGSRAPSGTAGQRRAGAARHLHGRRPRARPRRQPRHGAGRCSRPSRARCAASRASPSGRSLPSRPSCRCARASASRSASTRAERPYRWDVRRVGAARPVRKGRAAAGSARFRCAAAAAPASTCWSCAPAATRTSVPFLVQSPSARSCSSSSRRSRGSASTRSTTTATACPNTLDNGGPVKWPRVLSAGHGCRPAFAAETAPLLVFLDRARIRYDLTSDLVLARSGEPTRHRPRGRGARRLAALDPALAGAPPAALRRGTAGGVASFGTESMRRGVRVGEDDLSQPTQATPIDPFGARLEPVAAPAHRGRRPKTPLPLTALAEDTVARAADRLRRHADAFGRLEESAKRPDTANAKVLTALGQDVTDSERAEGRGQGRAAARGAPGADRHAARQGRRDPRRADASGLSGRATDREVGQITHNIVDILRRVTPDARRSSSDPQLRHPQRGDRQQLLGASSSAPPARPPGVERRGRPRPPPPARRTRARHPGWRASSAPARKNWSGWKIATARGRARQPHPPRLAHRGAGGDGRDHAREGHARRIDRDDAVRPAAGRAPAARDGSARAAGAAAGRGAVGPPLPDAIASALVADVDDLVEELRAPEGDPAGAIVLLHGRGTSEQDLLPLLDVFDPQERLVGAFPRGPLQLPPIGYHWYVGRGGRLPGPGDVHVHLRAARRLARRCWPSAPACRSSAP